MNNPQFCVCIPVYNAENTIEETIKSILNQSFSNFQIIISDNFSTDNSVNVIKKIKDDRISIIKTAFNSEIGEDNFNRCIDLSNAEFTAILHSDDIYHKDFLHYQLKNFQKNLEVGMSFTEGQNINDLGHFIKEIKSPIKKNNTHLYFDEIYPLILKNYNFLITPSLVFRTEFIKKHNLKWNFKDFSFSSDLALWLEASRKFKISIIKKNLISVRLSSNQGSALVRNKIDVSDFFLVTNHFNKHYATNKKRKKLIDKNMKLLKSRDNLRILSNLIYIGEYDKLENYFSNAICLEIFLNIYKKKYLYQLILYLILKIFDFIKLRKFNSQLIGYLKRNFYL